MNHAHIPSYPLTRRPQRLDPAVLATHWLRFDADRKITGCQCGFPAEESDEGWGDSVVAHIAAVAVQASGPRLQVSDGERRLLDVWAKRGRKGFRVLRSAEMTPKRYRRGAS